MGGFDLDRLRWWRVSAELLCSHASPKSKTPALSVFQALVKNVNRQLGESDDTTIFFHLRDKGLSLVMREGDRVNLEIFFCRHDQAFAARWREIFAACIGNPDFGKNLHLLQVNDPEERSLSLLRNEYGALTDSGELCLEFLTPLPFRPEPGKPRTHLSRKVLVSALQTRLQRLFGTGYRIDDTTDDYTVLSCYWNYTEHQRASQSQPGGVQYVNGCVGRLYLKGQFATLLPHIILASELHTGGKFSNAQGYFRIYRESRGYYSDFFPRKAGLVAAVREVIARYDHALEALSVHEQYPFNPETFAEELIRQFVEGRYHPEPASAFAIKKDDGTERLVETLPFRELIVQQYLLSLLDKPLERLFEEGAIGYRRGVSRFAAIKMVHDAVADGYTQVLETDIEDFFPSVDLQILERILDHVIPTADSLFRNILSAILVTGHFLKGEFHERVRGLAQGAPLSPLLANLYLDAFDEQALSWDVRMIRYADDLVILAKTREEAEKALHGAEQSLAGLGLALSKTKTAIRPVSDGFTFLGITFGASEAIVASEEELRLLKKPLYITEPYLFLAVSGDALELRRRKGELVETIPFRRLREIMVMGPAVFSTAVVKRCVDFGIPMTMTLTSGYYVTTVKPDTKRYYAVNAEHTARYHTLTDSAILSVAQEFAAGKLTNYLALFRQRGARLHASLIAGLRHTIEDIRSSGTVAEVRGHEGAAARKVYGAFNSLLEEDAFRFVKRERRHPDRLNSLLNLGYYHLFSLINVTVRSAGLNPYLGYLHEPRDDYESLVCDIEELFRPRIDRFIIRLVNKRIIKATDFETTDRGLFLNHGATKEFLNRIEGELEETSGRGELSLRGHIHAQVADVKRFVIDGADLALHEWRT